MQNPFDVIDNRLTSIETTLLNVIILQRKLLKDKSVSQSDEYIEANTEAATANKTQESKNQANRKRSEPANT